MSETSNDSPISYRDDAIANVTKNICVYHITEEQLSTNDVTLTLREHTTGRFNIIQFNKRFFMFDILIKNKNAVNSGTPIAVLKEHIISDSAKVFHDVANCGYGSGSDFANISLRGGDAAGQTGGGMYILSNTDIPANTLFQFKGFILADDDETITINVTPVYTTGEAIEEEEVGTTTP